MICKYSYYESYEDICVRITLPKEYEHETKEEAYQNANAMKLKMLLLPARILVLYGNKELQTYTYTEKKLYTISKIKVECKNRLNKLNKPENVVDYNKDYEIAAWTINELYGYLYKLWKPDIEYEGEKGYTFDSVAFKIIMC